MLPITYVLLPKAFNRIKNLYTYICDQNFNKKNCIVFITERNKIIDLDIKKYTHCCVQYLMFIKYLFQGVIIVCIMQTKDPMQ